MIREGRTKKTIKTKNGMSQCARVEKQEGGMTKRRPSGPLNSEGNRGH